MPDTFDPYSEWLGIPPDEQPPNHYRLLGLEKFESDRNLIAKATEEKMEHIRTFQLGKNFSFSQKLLGEIVTARVCLLNAEKKAAYDQHLRGESAVAEERAAVAPPALDTVSENPSTPFPDFTFVDQASPDGITPQSSAFRRVLGRKKKKNLPLKIALAVGSAVMVVVLLTLFSTDDRPEAGKATIVQSDGTDLKPQQALQSQLEAKRAELRQLLTQTETRAPTRPQVLPKKNVEWNALEPKFNTHTISKDASTAHGVFAADVDSDGDIDVLSAAYWGGKLAWYENDGSQNFVPHIISTDPQKSLCVYASDIDGDGDTDVLTASDVRFNGNGIAWYENDGQENFTPHIVSKSSAFRCVFARDVDSDGDTDILSASPNDNTIMFYENNGMQTFTSHTISNNAIGAHSVFAEDLDGDGDIDILSASAGDNKITWYENRGNHNFTSRIISTNAAGANCVFVCDVDGDGDFDVLSSSFGDNKIAWYENDGNEHFFAHTISTDHNNARSVFACDIDKDGDTDVISASSDDTKVAWHENDGQENFRTHIISKDTDAVSMYVADVDDDGDPDVLTASYGSGKIKWHENQQATTSVRKGARPSVTAIAAKSSENQDGNEGKDHPGQIGKWQDSILGMISIVKQGGNHFLVFKDGSRMPLKKSSARAGKSQFVPFDSDTGDYYLINAAGDLESWDSQGHISTAIKR